jgi:hypothetical protein
VSSSAAAPAVAFFVTSHGFGHATRACAVMNALREKRPDTRLYIASYLTPWLFSQSVSFDYGYKMTPRDTGIVQIDSLREDLDQTVENLDAALPYNAEMAYHFGRFVHEFGCQVVVCDIFPFGIEVANEAGLPSVVLENFTWHWIYDGYTKREPRLAVHADYMGEVFGRKDYHIQTEPICEPMASADLVVPPISRKPRSPAHLIRRQLRIGGAKKIIVITMGGVPFDFEFFDRLRQHEAYHFIVLGGDVVATTEGNISRLPWASYFYHPDLINAADAVIGKVGYSTLAEVYHGGAPFGYIGRKAFRESAVLMAFIASQMEGIEISEEDFRSGAWLSVLPALVALPKKPRRDRDGASAVAQFILDLAAGG